MWGGSITDGWRRLRESAAGAMTRFKLGGNFSPLAPVDDDFYLASRSARSLASAQAAD